MLNGPRIHEFLQEMHREVFAGRPPGLLNVGETPGCPIEEAVLYTDPARGELDMVFQFEHVDLDSGPRGKWDLQPLTMLQLKQSLGRWQDGLAEVGWNSLYLGNHDQPRCVSRFGSDDPEHREQSAKALATVLHLHRGTPYVYQGDELGPAQRRLHLARPAARHRVAQPLRHRDRAGRGARVVMAALSYKGRDNARVPMPWDSSSGAGFSAGTPWLDLHPLSASVNAAAQVDDPDSVFSHYRRLIALRHDEPCVAHGTFRMLLADHEELYCFERELRRHPAAGRRQPVVGRRRRTRSRPSSLPGLWPSRWCSRCRARPGSSPLPPTRWPRGSPGSTGSGNR